MEFRNYDPERFNFLGYLLRKTSDSLDDLRNAVSRENVGNGWDYITLRYSQAVEGNDPEIGGQSTRTIS